MKIIKTIKEYKYILILFLILICIITGTYFYSIKNLVQRGLKNNTIIFGQSASLSKKNFILGREYSLGYYLAFSKYNQENKKYKIKLLIYDDQYNRELTKINVELFDKYTGIFGLVGTVGTPTSTHILDYVVDKNIPFIQPLTGSNLLRNQFKKNIIHTRPSYYDELELIIRFLIKNKKKNITIIYQNDDFGYSIVNDINFLLTRNKYINKISIISSASYESTDLVLNKTFANLLGIKNSYNINEINKSSILKSMDALLVLSGSKTAIESIKYFKINKPSLYIFTISFTEIYKVNNNIKNMNNKYLENIYSTEIVLINKDNDKNLIKELQNNENLLKKKLSTDLNMNNEFLEYKNILKDPKIPPTLIEGYINGLFINHIIDNIDGEFTRENFINTIYKLKNINIFNYKFGPYIDIENCKKLDKNCPCNVGLKNVYLYKFNISTKNYILQKFRSTNIECNRI